MDIATLYEFLFLFSKCHQVEIHFVKQGGYLCAVGAFVEGVKLKRKRETEGPEAEITRKNAYKI